MQVYARRTAPCENVPSPDSVTGDVLLLDDAGRVLVKLEGVRIQRVGRQVKKAGEIDIRSWLYEIDWQEVEQVSRPVRVESSNGPHDASADPTETNSATGTWLLLADSQGVAESLAEQLTAAGGSCVIVRHSDKFSEDGGAFTISPTSADDYSRLLDSITGAGLPSLRGVVHLWSQDIPDLASDESAVAAIRELSCASALQTIQALARRGGAKPPALWLLTAGAQAIADDDKVISPAQSALWGLGRVAALEHPELQCRLVDVDAQSSRTRESSGAGSLTTSTTQLAAELADPSDENQIAYRQGRRYVARLKHAPDALAKSDNNAGGELVIPGDAPSRVRLAQAGSIDGLAVERFARQEPPPGHVELEVKATGLNFSDVLKAMGLYPGIKDEIVPMGIECGGVITRVGEGVDRFKVGDEVMGVAPYSFATHAITTDYALVHKPRTLDFEEAATVPITFLTAYYGLVRLADMQPGERLLIHAGAGGVGLAAIQIAQQIGVEIYATAGSESKREYLRSLGVKHVFNSRTLDFAEEILDITDREGVDVVLNSLPGDAIPKSLGILRAYGRFLEIGKTDIYSNRMIGLEPFQDNLSYFAIDLDRMLRQRPDYIRKLYADMMRHFESGEYTALPLIQFAYPEVRDAYRYMAQRKNVGKVVVSVCDRPMNGEVVHEEVEEEQTIKADATYLITGGLGALGLQVADWLASQGAKHIALLSRRVPNETAAAAIAQLEAKGVRVAALTGDAGKYDSLCGALKQLPADFPPLRGVMHAAGVLDDGVLYDMSLERLEKPLASKIDGAWNLHRATADTPLDWFVMFSSVAALLGSPGQGNYAAGNAFLDGLAAYRRARSLPAISIAWGPWAESGMAAEEGRDAGLADRGMDLLPVKQSLEVLGELLRSSAPAHVAVMAVRWSEMLAAYHKGPPPLLAPMASEADAAPRKVDEVDHVLRTKLVAAGMDERTQLLRDYFAEQLAKIMGLAPEDLELTQPLNTIGLDSLMAIELKNTIESRLAVTLSMALFMEGPSVTSLAGDVAKLLAEDAS